MLYTETSVRNNLRNREGKRVFYLAKGDRLTDSAREFLRREGIQILDAEEARPDRYQLPGGYMEEKPEHMTHLNAQVLVCKTHPRIRFRGALDTLQAHLLLCQCRAEGQLRRDLGQVLTQVREILRCEVLDTPVPEARLCGLDPEQLRRHSHFPQDYYGQPHFMPEAEDGELLLLLNLARAAAREAEILAVDAFLDREGQPTRGALLQAMNRISSMLYLLMIRVKADLPAGKTP